MSDENDNNEFDFLPPAEPPPAFTQEKDSYHEEVDAEAHVVDHHLPDLFIRTRRRGARSGLFRSWAGVCVAGRRRRLGAGPAGVVPSCCCRPRFGGRLRGTLRRAWGTRIARSRRERIAFHKRRPPI